MGPVLVIIFQFLNNSNETPVTLVFLVEIMRVCHAYSLYDI